MALHAFQALERALTTALVLGDARCFLDEGAALLGLAGKDGVELALTDDGVRLLAQTRVVQDVGDVEQAGGGTVDEVLALARAVHAAGDHDLLEVDGQHVIGVVERQINLGHAHRLARRGARKDHVLHRGAAQLLGALLAQDPADGVADIGLARAVGAHDNRESRLEHHMRPVCERFESLEGERLEIHRLLPVRRARIALRVEALGDRRLVGACNLDVTEVLERLLGGRGLGLLLRGAHATSDVTLAEQAVAGKHRNMGRSAHADKLVARSFAELCLGLLLQQRLGVLLGKRTAGNHEGAEGVEHPTPGKGP